MAKPTPQTKPAEPATVSSAEADGAAPPSATTSPQTRTVALPPPSASATVDPSLPRWPATPPAPAASGDHLYSKVRHLWIRSRPFKSRSWLGYLSLGDAVRVRGGDAKTAFKRKGHGEGCEAWYAVEPLGYVCAGAKATLDGNDPAVVALRKHAAKRDSPWPYQYGESLQTPVYRRAPSAAKQRQREIDLERHLKRVTQARAALADDDPGTIHKALLGVDLAPATTPLPEPLTLPLGGRPVGSRVVRGSTVAFVGRFDHVGRPFLLTWDRAMIPADRIRPYPQSHFRGVVLNSDQRLPIAFFRKKDRPKFRITPDGTFEPTGENWTRLSWIGLTGNKQTANGKAYFETKEAGAWCAADQASVVSRRDTPAAVVDGEGRRTWMDVEIGAGTLVAYEGDTPVYATLISPGRGGAPTPGVPTLDTAATPTGIFRVLGKFLTATMQSGSVATLVHAEVQYTMNFSGPYAMHGAYWHDRWGEKKSGGCVNLSPIDSQRIFEWSEPRLPSGWHGMRTIGRDTDYPTPTLIQLRR